MVLPAAVKLSRRHFEIRRTHEGFRILDGSSCGGTWVGTEPVMDSGRLLRDGDRILSCLEYRDGPGTPGS